MGRHNFAAQKLEAKILSLVSVYSHAHRFASASCYTAAYLYSMVYEQSRGHEGALVGLAPQTQLQDPQIEIWNTIN